MGWGKYLGIAAALASLLFCSDSKIPCSAEARGRENAEITMPAESAGMNEVPISSLGYVSQDDVDKALAGLEKIMSENGAAAKMPKIRIFMEKRGIGSLRINSAIDYEDFSVNMYTGCLDDMAQSCLNGFLENRQEIESTLESPLSLEKRMESGKFYLLLKDALFYRALGNPESYKSADEFKRAYKRVCFLDFLVSASASLNDGLPESKKGIYADVFSAHQYARARHFSGIVLGSFDEAWAYFAIGRSLDMVNIGYDDSHRNGGCKTLEMFISSMTSPNVRKAWYEPVGIKYSQFDSNGNPKYLFMQITRIPTSAVIRRNGKAIFETRVLEEVMKANLRAYYKGKPLRENMPRLIEAAREYLGTVNL